MREFTRQFEKGSVLMMMDRTSIYHFDVARPQLRPPPEAHLNGKKCFSAESRRRGPSETVFLKDDADFTFQGYLSKPRMVGPARSLSFSSFFDATSRPFANRELELIVFSVSLSV